MNMVYNKAKNAKTASIIFSSTNTEKKNSVLKRVAMLLNEKRQPLLEANAVDLENAEQLLKEGKLNNALIKRLKLTSEKIDEIIEGVKSVAGQEELTGKTLSTLELDKGLELYRVSVPIGVICCIFESRPDALVQISSLCIKSGNAVILKGGSEALETNRFLFNLIRQCLEEEKLDKEALQLIETRADVKEILDLDGFIDLIIPRGSNSFVKFIQENTRIPVLGHASGICHVFVDKEADLCKAEKICFDAKTQYPAVCNAMETMLVHSAVAKEFLPNVCKKLIESGVKLFADKEALVILKENNLAAEQAKQENWSTEYNDLILNVRIVNCLDEAISHINQFGSRHTDSIVSEDKERSLKFINMVDSSSVMVNASTRFSDGYRYGLGAEVGINTGKIHTRGPSGLESLLTYKYILVGNGNIVADYSGKDAKKFSHKKLEKEWNSGY